jgi:hypothetical protein
MEISLHLLLLVLVLTLGSVPTLWYETWSLTLREKYRLRVFENRVLKGGIFGPKGDEVIGGWRKLHNEELHNVYDSSIIIRMMKSRRMGWTGHVARMGEKRNSYRILVGKPEGLDEGGRIILEWILER